MSIFSCPSPFDQNDVVTLAHGAGGAQMQGLIESCFGVFNCSNDGGSIARLLQATRHDGAVVKMQGQVAFTTDSYVVKPLQFPGGDIGKLAVLGTCNDLAVCGALPQYLSCAVIIEEGFSLALLQEIANSMNAAARQVGVNIVTGDTKVVPRGDADKLFINTAGIGTLQNDFVVSSRLIKEGDKIILSADLGRHGLAILSARQNLKLRTPIFSDCAYIGEPILATLRQGKGLRFVRDLTRGGLGCVLHEIANDTAACLLIDEEKLLVSSEVQSLCEMFGLEPMNLANEGCFLMVVDPSAENEILALLRNSEVSRQACVIGVVQSMPPEGLQHIGKGRVELRNSYGAHRLFPYLAGEILPRIC